MNMNKQRINQLVKRGKPAPKCYIGMWVSHPRHGVGVVDAQFVDLQAAVDCGLVDGEWYSIQSARPKTSPVDGWVSVILEDGGAVLIGVDDLVPA